LIYLPAGRQEFKILDLRLKDKDLIKNVRY